MFGMSIQQRCNLCSLGLQCVHKKKCDVCGTRYCSMIDTHKIICHKSFHKRIQQLLKILASLHYSTEYDNHQRLGQFNAVLYSSRTGWRFVYIPEIGFNQNPIEGCVVCGELLKDNLMFKLSITGLPPMSRCKQCVDSKKRLCSVSYLPLSNERCEEGFSNDYLNSLIIWREISRSLDIPMDIYWLVIDLILLWTHVCK